jgi:dTDP-4-amino-4,6-dideoxygalactose transaminase
MGAEVTSFEEEASAFLEVKHAIAVSSGTDAILLALTALGIGPGDEVICPAFTFFATASCVARLGATPVFADVCPACFNLDPADVERKITARTKAILPVHLYGQAAEMDRLMALARSHHIHLIEDAAQSLGARYRGKQVGTFGAFGTYSFFPSKNLGALGDAGLLVTDNDELAHLARILRVHGMEPKYFHPHLGGNFRIDALQAALLRVKLKHLPAYNQRRQENAAFYLKTLRPLTEPSTPALERCACLGQPDALSSAPLILPEAYPHNDHIWNQFTLRIPSPDGSSQRRDSLREHLTRSGIGCDIYYPLGLHLQECFKNLGGHEGDHPVTERLAREVISLPIYPDLNEAQLTEVVDSIRAFVAHSG